MIYTTGTIAGNGSTITGTGTNFTAAGSLIRVGCTLIAFTNPVQVLQITAITSGTVLSVTPAISPAIAAGTKYAILLSDSLSVDGLAQDIAETFGMYQKYMGGFADVMNGTGDVTITINGTPVTVPGQKSVAKKGANKDITSLSGLTTALSIGQGGTGANDFEGARGNLNIEAFMALAAQSLMYAPGRGTAIRIDVNGWGCVKVNDGKPVPLGADYGGTGSSTQWGACTNIGAIRPKEARFQSGDSPTDEYWRNSTGFLTGQMEGGPLGAWMDITSFDNAARMQLVGFYSNGAGAKGFGYKVFNPNGNTWSTFSTVRDDQNTTIDTNGFIKRASPVIKLFADGTFEVNDESEGCVVTRNTSGEYLIHGCMGLNADAGWGGIDGGFEIPLDRNKQPRIWLDYEVSADGSVLIKTYHRTHPEAPEFARNRIGHSNDDGSFTELVKNGEPVDIPAGSFVSVRVEMPANSIWNQKQSTVVIPEEGELQS